MEAAGGNGLIFELHGGLGLIDTVSIAGGNCRQGGKAYNPVLACIQEQDAPSLRARVKFGQLDGNRLGVAAKFLRRSFDKADLVEPLEARIIIAASPGTYVSAHLVCKSSGIKRRCAPAVSK